MIAIVLWFTLSLGEHYTILVEIDTQVTNLQQDTVLTRLPPKTVQARLSGTGTALFGVRFNPPILSIDASEDIVNVRNSVPLPNGITADEFYPQSFGLHKDERITRFVPVRSTVVFEPDEAFDFFTAPTIFPDSVRVEGARSIVSEIKDWPTQTVVRRGIKDSVGVLVPLTDSLPGLVVKSPAIVTVSNRVHEYTQGERVLTVASTELPTINQAVELDPPSVVVRYRVPLDQYEAAREAEDFYATVSYQAIRIDTTGRVLPEIHLPTELLLRQVEVHPRALKYFVYIGDE